MNDNGSYMTDIILCPQTKMRTTKYETKERNNWRWAPIRITWQYYDYLTQHKVKVQYTSTCEAIYGLGILYHLSFADNHAGGH